MIGRQMDLEPQQDGESDADCFRRWFVVARQRGVIEKLRDFVDGVKVVPTPARDRSGEGQQKENRQ
jgi:hypothetical protein